jgi:hypothetical protein
MKFTRTVLIAAALMIGGSAQASQLVYRPTNPSLGGDPLNGNWLLSQASAQGEGASQSPGFSIDFPDFGGVTQPEADPDTLPGVDPTTP